MNVTIEPLTPPHLVVFTKWTLLTMGIAVIGMLIFSAVLIFAVLWASGKPVIPWSRVKSALATALWVASALGVVAWVGVRTSVRTVVTAERMPTSESDLTARSNAPARLRIRQTSSDAPTWINPASEGPDGPAQIVLSSQRFATLEEAETQITEQAAVRIREYWRASNGGNSPAEVPVSLIEQFAVKEMVGEIIDKDFGNGIKGKMYRVHLWLDTTDSRLRDAVQKLWHSQVAEYRLILLGSAAGLMTLMLGAAAGYFRLDELTGGQYRGRLQLAAASLITAGGLVAATVIG